MPLKWPWDTRYLPIEVRDQCLQGYSLRAREFLSRSGYASLSRRCFHGLCLYKTSICSDKANPKQRIWAFCPLAFPPLVAGAPWGRGCLCQAPSGDPFCSRLASANLALKRPPFGFCLRTLPRSVGTHFPRRGLAQHRTSCPLSLLLCWRFCLLWLLLPLTLRRFLSRQLL